MEKIQISHIQLFMLLSGFLFGSTVIISPVQEAANDGWLAILLGGAGGFLLMWLYVKIALLNPSKTLVEILKERMGKVVGNILAVFYIWYFIHIASMVFRDFGEFITAMTFPETPMGVIIGIFAVLVVYVLNSGIEVLARLCEILVPIIYIAILIISLALITVRDFTAFLPFLENGITPVLKSAFSIISFPFGEAVAFLMVFPILYKEEKLKKVVFSATIVAIATVLIVFFRDLFVLGSGLIRRTNFVPHLTTLILPWFNVEPLLDINLMIGGGAKISICIYAAVKGLSQIIKIDDYRSLTGAVVIFSVVLCIWSFENVLELFAFTDKVWPFYSLPFQVIIPLLLLLLSFRNKSRPSKQGAQTQTGQKESNTN